MIPLHVFSIADSEATSIRVDGTVEEYLREYPEYTHEFTVYGWKLDDIPSFPPYIKPLIIIQDDSFPYATKLVDVVYSIFPNPENSSKIAVYRRPVRNSVPVHFYQTSDGVKASLVELNLPHAMELARVFMPMKSYRTFAPIGRTCMPVDGQFKNSSSFNSCVSTTKYPDVTETTPFQVTVNDASSTDTTDTAEPESCNDWFPIGGVVLFAVLVAAVIWKLWR